jgi:autotransporter-associated beta strand protein
MTNGVLNWQSAVLAAYPWTGSFIFTNGTCNFATASSANAFAGFTTSKTFVIGNGVTIDNTSGSPITMQLGTLTNALPAYYVVAGSFNFTGSSSLNFGTNTVLLTNSTPTITVSANTLTLGSVKDAAGATAGLTTAGAGTLAISGASAYTGSTFVSQGTLALTALGSLANSAGISVSNAAFDLSGLTINDSDTTPIGMTSSTLNLSNALLTAVSSFSISNSTLNVSIPSLTATDIVTTTLNMGDTTNVLNITKMPLLNSYPTTFPIIKYTTLNGTYNLGLGTIATPSTPYTAYLTNDTVNNMVKLVVTGGPLVRLLTWSGLNGAAPDGNWNVAGDPTWRDTNNSATTYNQLDIVTFNDSATGQTSISLASGLTPGSLTVSNNVKSYTFTGGNIGDGTGALTLNKQGTGTLLLQESGDHFSGGIAVNNGMVIIDNDSSGIQGGATIAASGTLQEGNNDGSGNPPSGTMPSGTVTDNGALVFSRTDTGMQVTNVISGSGTMTQVGGGTVQLAGSNTLFNGQIFVAAGNTLQAGNDAALGSTNTVTSVANTASLDVNGHNLTQNTVVAQGSGVGGEGAIFSSSPLATGTIAVGHVVLLGDTVFGGPAGATVADHRWDIRGTGSSLSNSPAGSHYNIAKVGGNEIAFSGLAVDSGMGNIDIQNGLLSVETTTTGLGDPTKTLAVENGATLQLYALTTNQVNKQIVLNGNGLNQLLGTINIGSGSGSNNTVIGPMTLNGDVQVTYRAAATGAQGPGVLTLSNAITGTGSLTKDDTNILTLAGTDNHSGGTINNSGTLVLNIVNTNLLNVLSNAPYATIGGNGTNAAPVLASGSSLWPGAGGKPGTFGSGLLVLDASFNTPQLEFDLGTNTTAGGGVNDLLNVNGDIDFTTGGGPNPSAGSVTIAVNPVGVLQDGTYTLINYTGSLVGGGGTASFSTSISGLGSTRYTGVLSFPSHQVALTISGTPGLLEWINGQNDGVWQVQNGEQGWTNLVTHTSPDLFYNGDTVLLDDTIINAANPLTTINIPSGNVVSPAWMTNNSTTNYTIVGPGAIGGTGGLVKMGGSTLTIAATNTFTGPVTISGGTILVNSLNALGATASPLYITNGGTLDVGGSNFAANANPILGLKPIYVSGAGVGGEGAIVNNGTNQQQDAVQDVIMTGDTTFGGNSRWDFRAAPSTLLTSPANSPYNITKVGTNQVSLVAVTNIDPAISNIDIQLGEFAIQTTTIQVGDPNGTITVRSNAILDVYALTAGPLNKRILMLDGGAFTNESGADVSMGQTTLGTNALGGPGNCTFGIGGTSLTLSNVVSGPGNLVKVGGSPLYLSATNTYTGATYVNVGMLALTNTGSIYNSTNIMIATGAVLNAGLRIDGTLALSNNQTLGGVGTVTGNLIASSGSTVSPGTNSIGLLTVSGAVQLHGTTYIEVNKATATTNDQLFAGGTVAYDGTLLVTNLGTAFVAGDSFKIFSASGLPAYSGAFTSIIPATPGAGLAWDTNALATSGTLNVVATPVDTGVQLGGPASVAVELNITYNITVTNIGPVTAVGMAVTDTLPANVSFVSANDGGTPSGGQVVWSGFGLGANTGTNFTLVVNATSGGNATNTVSVASSASDPNPANNTASLVTTVTTGPGVFTNKPGITHFSITNGNILITGTNGQNGDAYYLLESTNVASSLSLWVTVATNVLGADGNFTFIGTNVVTPGDKQQFYILSNTNSNY